MRMPLIAVVLWLASSLYTSALAHGALLDARPVPGVMVEARYDTGDPMDGAQITIYAPNDPTRPFLSGVADANGMFGFVPDPDIAGRWTVQARQAGHGAMAYIETTANETVLLVEPASQSITPLQRALMAASIVWGLIGTALYFRREKR